jgi:hypothetical protein
MPIDWFVSQISQPVRIILIGAVVFLAAWFTLLRPKSEPAVPPLTTSTTTTAPPVSTPQTGLGRAVEAAKKVAGKATATTAQPAATAVAGTKATTSAPDVKSEPAAIAAVPAEALAKLPKDVAGALKARKVLVLGVLSQDTKPWRPVADDDRYVRNALKKANRYDGQVVVKQVALDKLSAYGSLVNDLGVTQSPSIVVIDRDLKGTVLIGYADTVSINQVIADARRASIHPNTSNAYLRDINSLCTNMDTSLARWSHPTVQGQPALTASYKRGSVLIRNYRLGIKRLAAPAKYKGFKAAFLKVITKEQKRIDGIVKASKTKTLRDDYKADALVTYKDWRAFDKKANDLGATSCAINRSK